MPRRSGGRRAWQMVVVNDKGLLHVVDVWKAPFSRPDLACLAKGLKYIRNSHYPIRGRLA